ncbi:hypothetical protein BOX15_Mlig030115g2, partial [Macrostomum lignano]
SSKTSKEFSMATCNGSNLSLPKVINDPIHGTIELHKFAELIMGAPEFQRLRHLKQLGVTYLVYPSGTHTRFEHSVGTYHLAWQLAKTLKSRATTLETELTDDEVLCVALAGLCHDLGHGPFSHLWEVLVKTGDRFADYHHEGMSVQLVDRIIDQVIGSGLSGAAEFADFMRRRHEASGGTNRELIKQLILGGPEDQEIPPGRQFLYEIISNKRTGFDVDKWDYINRDSYFLGLNNKLDCQRQLAMLRVLPCGQGRNLLVIRDKQVLEYIQLLVARRVNHYVGYQHIKVIGFEKLLGDALQAGRSFLESQPVESVNPDARRYLLEASGSVETLCWLTDARLELLLTEHCGPTARHLMQRLVTRKMYSLVATARLALKDPEDKRKYESAIKKARAFSEDWNRRNPQASDYSTIAEFRKIDYGSGLNHPLDEVFAYSKRGSAGQRCSEKDLLFPDLLLSAIHVSIVRLYERSPGQGRQRQEAEREFLSGLAALGFMKTVE